MADLDDAMLGWLRQQHGVVARGQLLAHGSADQIKRRLHSRRLERVHEAVYRDPAFPRTWRQALMAACLAGGKASVASFRSAARLWELPGGAELLEITSHRHRHARHQGVIPHESRHLEPIDVTALDGIPVTRPARTLCDLAGLVEERSLGRDVLELSFQEALRRDLVDVAVLWQTWERLGATLRLGGTEFDSVLRSLVPPSRGADSRAELRLLQLFRSAAIPEPETQFPIEVSDGRILRLDFAWPSARLCVEFDSYKYHGGRVKYLEDSRRNLLIQARGWSRVSVTDDELDAGAELAISVVSAALRAGVDAPYSFGRR